MSTFTFTYWKLKIVGVRPFRYSHRYYGQIGSIPESIDEQILRLILSLFVATRGKKLA